MPACPHCGAQQPLRAISWGLPHWFCDGCHCVYGFWGPVVLALPFTGVMFTYPPRFGAYWPALWAWLRGEGE